MTEAKDIYKTLLVGSFLSSVWMQSQKSEHFTAVLAGKVKDTCASGQLHAHHGETCCTSCFPTHSPAPVCFVIHAVSHTWKYMLTVCSKGAVCIFGAGNTGAACCAMDNQRVCWHRLSWRILHMQLAKSGLSSVSPERGLNEVSPFKNLSLTNDFYLAYEYHVSFHWLMSQTSI